MIPSRCLCTILLLFGPAAAVHAQSTQGDPPAMRSVADCHALASMPRSTVTVEACLARMNAQGELAEAVDAPGGERAGDEAMSCTQVIAEMQAARFSGVSAATATQGQEAGEALAEAYQKRVGMAATMSARHTVETAAAAFGPNAVQGAVAYAHAAEQKAAGNAAIAEIRPVRERAMLSNAASAQELAGNLRANPRFARLMQLVQIKQCQFSDAPPGSAGP